MEPVELKIDQSVIRPIIEARINAAVIEMMKGQDQMILGMVNMWMSQRVDSDGNSKGYGADKPRVEWLVNQMLQEAMKKALTEYLQERKELMTKAFEKFLKSKEGTSKIIEAMNHGLVDALANKWNVNVAFNLGK